MVDQNIIFRLDSSSEIGIGHLFRCITLANKFAEKGLKCHFICRDFKNNSAELISKNGHNLHLLPFNKGFGNQGLGNTLQSDVEETISIINTVGNAAWVVCDHYDIDKKWEESVSKHTKKILVIDDLANRHHFCDILIDQTYGRSSFDYKDLVPPSCKILTGSNFCILKKSFHEKREQSLFKKESLTKVKNVIISMGGSDNKNLSGKIVNELSKDKQFYDMSFNLVIGSSFTEPDKLRTIISKSPLKINAIEGLSDLSDLMTEADIAIGTPGTTTWERCCLGLPSIIVTTASNQLEIANNIVNHGAAICANGHDEALIRDIVQILQILKNDPKKLKEISKRASEVCDGRGTDRILKELL